MRNAERIECIYTYRARSWLLFRPRGGHGGRKRERVFFSDDASRGFLFTRCAVRFLNWTRTSYVASARTFSFAPGMRNEICPIGRYVLLGFVKSDYFEGRSYFELPILACRC